MAVSEFLLEWFITSDYEANLNFEAKKTAGIRIGVRGGGAGVGTGWRLGFEQQHSFNRKLTNIAPIP